MVDATSTPARSSKAAPAKVEIVIGDMVIRTAVDVELLSEVIRAVRASR
jgi:transposase